MKKFLTVLLVIAVMFTFSFGSAFAYVAPTDQVKADLLEEARTELEAAKGELALLKAVYLNSIASGVDVSYTSAVTSDTATTITISQDTIEGAILDAAFAKVDAKLAKAYSDLVISINNGTIAGGTYAAAVDTIEGLYDTVLGYYTSNFTNILTGVAVDVAGTDYDIAANADAVKTLVEAEYEAARAEAIEAIDKALATAGNYSTEKPETANVNGLDGEAATAYMSNKEIVEATLNSAKKTIANEVFATTTSANVKLSIDWYFAAVAGQVTGVDADNNIDVYYFSPRVSVVDKVNGTVIPTLADDAKADKTLDETKAYYISVAKGKLALAQAALTRGLNFAAADKTNGLTKAQRAEYTALAADLANYFAAIEEIATAQINYAETEAEAANYVESATQLTGLGHRGWGTEADIFVSATAPSTGSVGDYTTAEVAETKTFLDKLVGVTKKVDALEALAAKMLAETGLNGEAAYVATVVEKALAEDIEATYTTYDDAGKLEAIPAVADAAKLAMAGVIGTADGDTVTIDKVVYPAIVGWQADVDDTTPLYDEDNAEAAQAVIDATKAAVRAAKSVADVHAAFVKGYAEFDAVPTLADQSKFQNLKTTKDLIAAYETKLAAVLQTKVAEYGTTKFAKDYEATTNLVANLGNEYLDTAYDAAGLEAGYNAAVAEINNLMTKAELAAEQKAINDAIVAIKTVTLADEAAILALAEREADFEDYKELIGVTGYTTYGVDTYRATLAGLVKAKLDADLKAIGTVTLEDEAAIEALVAAAEAYAENYGDLATGYVAFSTTAVESALLNAKINAVDKAIGAINANANPVDAAAVAAAREAYDALAENGLSVRPAMYAKLIALENTVALQVPTGEELGLVVEGLKITAKSSAKKGSITVKWTVEGDDANVDYYEVRKSTKKNSGFGTKPYFTTEKTSYKNTKGLKAGTRYYYKVRAVAEIDGVVYTSDWSNKAYRVAK